MNVEMNIIFGKMQIGVELAEMPPEFWYAILQHLEDQGAVEFTTDQIFTLELWIDDN